MIIMKLPSRLRIRRAWIAFLAICIVPTIAAQYNTKNLAPALDRATEELYSCEKLRLYPIIANEGFRQAHRDIGKAVPMNMALADGRLKISEQEGSATVNSLQVKNTSQDTIYLMQGEVIIGGKQDRILAQDLLVPPGASMDIAAFCVEHGRWSEQATGADFKGTKGVAAQEVRKAAAVSKQQGQVWDAVARMVQVSATRTSTGSYAHMVDDKTFNADREKYRERLVGLPATCVGVVGVVAVIGGKVIGCDILATEDLFRQAYPQLIDAYIAEALTSGAPVTMEATAVQDYFTSLFGDESQLEQKIGGNGSLFKSKGHTYRLSAF